MGAGIAEVFARHGFAVVGVERDDDALAIGRGHVERSTGRAVSRGRLSEDEQKALIARITFTTEQSELALCDLVIEAVPELLDMKTSLVERLDGILAADAIIATNTSSLSVTEIAAASSHRERVVGMHFFNPAPVLKLVEVIRAEQTAPEVVDTVEALARRLGKSPVVCDDRAGFIANALLIGYLNHAAAMVGSVEATKEDIDESMRAGAGFPMGPLTLLDLIGLDTCVEILERMYSETGRDRHITARVLRELVDAGKLGRKTGAGFYEYGDVAEPVPGAVDEKIVDALLRPYLDDARVMADSGYASETDIDTAMTLGCGLPEGPFAMLARGVVERL
jgi:3-hydroxybutyryl-CoA dehydrogenase